MKNLSEMFNAIAAAVNDFCNLPSSYVTKDSFINYSEMFHRFMEMACKEKEVYPLTIKNNGWSYGTFICPLHKTETTDRLIPLVEERVNDKVTVLLHWGMNGEFLTDFTTWGHEKCAYKVEDVPYSVVVHFTEEYESNYLDLYNAIVAYKATGVWSIPEEIEED